MAVELLKTTLVKFVVCVNHNRLIVHSKQFWTKYD